MFKRLAPVALLALTLFGQSAVAQDGGAANPVNEFVTVLLETIGVIIGTVILAGLAQLIGRERAKAIQDAGFALEPFIDMAIDAAKKRYKRTSFAQDGLDNEILDFIVSQLSVYAPTLIKATGFNIKTEKGRMALSEWVADRIFANEQEADDEAGKVGF
jgi:hypothetical protein